ncbi:SpoIIE family protein phosphatase [Actinoallomurus soli]|uniref:SpoIIE family protein phosphatase n=1 Tax=Actinoallomurus soli TaxID=2952535 RepID=UPI0020922D7B|nr:SpoIIE family protein phosphatase [Actinoallomurus soli]MCO5973120.1 SpoIIE family protein phosphatase [Actinoallomurus soli]
MTVPPDDVMRLTALVAEQRQRLEDARDRTAARALTDIATGILVDRLGCSPAEALGHLARLAAGTGTSLVDLAADLVNLAADDPLAEAARRAADEGGPVASPRLAEAAVLHAEDGDAMAAALLGETLSLSDAVAAALWALRPDGALELVGAAGFDPLERGHWRRVPPQMDSLQQRVVRDGAPIWWPGGAARRRGVPPLTGAGQDVARAVLPLSADGGCVGVLEIRWAAGLPGFTPAVRAELTALARVCAQTLDARPESADEDRLLDAAAVLTALSDAFLLLSPVRDASGRVVDLRIDRIGREVPRVTGYSAGSLLGQRLSHVSPQTALPGGPLDVSLDVLETGRPAEAEWSIAGAADEPVHRVRIARIFDRLTFTWDDGERIGASGALLEQVQRLGRIGAWQHDLVSGRVMWSEPTFALFGLPPSARAIGLEELPGNVDPQDRVTVRRFREQLLRLHRPAFATFRLVRPDASIRQIRAFAEPVTDPSGAVIAIRGAYQDVSDRYHSEVALAATQDRLADTEQRAEDQERLALHLQEAILPSTDQPVSAFGLDVAVRYRPAGGGQLVGGDWYDAVVLPSKKVLLAVGDIAGHGLDAVTGMVALRNSLRGLAITGAGPAELLGMLNNVAYHLTGGTFATAICALYDPSERSLRWARAGHLPPVLVRDGDAGLLPLPAGFLLGLAPDAVYEEATTSLELGDALLLFTDGLVERRDMPLDEALQELIRLAGRPVGDAERFSDHLLDGTIANTNDDTCLVTIHLR